MQTPTIEIYTDGSYSSKKKLGGWAFLILHKGVIVLTDTGQDQNTTNNRMELKAALEALKTVKKGSSVKLHTDSNYLKKGITEWIHTWKANGWRAYNRKPVKNIDLWQELHKATVGISIEWIWVKAHNGNKYNELADKMARV